MLGLHREGDAEFVRELECALGAEQDEDGSFAGSPMRTAGTLNLLDDLRATGSHHARQPLSTLRPAVAARLRPRQGHPAGQTDHAL